MVNLVVTQAPLLSGSLRECAQIGNLNRPEEIPLDDSNCSEGGLVSVKALSRLYSKINTTTTEASAAEGVLPTLVIPVGDFKSPLTTMSRFHFGVNTMIFGELGFRTWTLPAYTLHNGRFEEYTLYDGQDPNFPALVSNVVTSPEELAHPYIRSIHFDSETQLAVIYLTKEYLVNTHSQRQTTQRLLQYIYKRNQANGCNLDQQPTAYSVERSGYSAFFSPTITPSSSSSFSDWFKTNPDPNRNVTFPPQEDIPENCYLPVIIFDDKDLEQYDLLMESLRKPTQADIGDGAAPTLRPHLLVDLYGHAMKSAVGVSSNNGDNNQEEPIWIQRTTDFYSTIPLSADSSSETTTTTTASTWIVSYKWSATDYHQIEIDLAPDSKSIQNVQVAHEDLTNLPLDIRQTPEYTGDLDRLRQYAREALQSSLLNEHGVSTDSMPAMTSPIDGFRRCYVGECELGNLVADALRWTEQADVAVLPSFLFHGPGWQAGEIRTLELLENVPYTAPRCSATLKGNSLLRLLQHSIATTSFGPYDGVQQGGRLLQVSGMRMVYNNNQDEERMDPAAATTGNILSVDIWDRDQDAYRPLNRTRLYSVVSINHLCFTFSDFPEYLGSLLVEEGEVMAFAHPDTELKTETKNYLIATVTNQDDGGTYRPRLEGRHQVDLSSSSVPLVVHEAFNCIPGVTFWDSSILECTPCPSFAGVSFSDDRAQLLGRAYETDIINHKMILTNQESFSIQVCPEALTLPENMRLLSSKDHLLEEATHNNTSNGMVAGDELYRLEPNDSVVFNIYFDPSDRTPGTDTSSLVFGVKEVSRSGLCLPIKMKYEIEARLTLSRESNNLDNVAYFGYTAAAVIILTSLCFASWVHWRRKTPVVSAMQPFFLVTLCMGVLLMGSSLIPLSVDDGVATTQRGINMACMARPWLLVLGFSISVAALFSKLYRINKLFSSQQFRRVKVREQDVLWPTGIIILLNAILLSVWTILDPLQWERVQVSGQPWNTYGTCQLGDGPVGKAMLSSIVSLCAISFFLTVWQAFLARNISSEFSESKYLGIAVFSWVQLLIVGVPVMFLVDDDNVVARYSLVVGLLIAVCLSMLLVVFVPTILAHKQREANPRSNVMVMGVINSGTANENHSAPFRYQHHSREFNPYNSARTMEYRQQPAVGTSQRISAVRLTLKGGRGASPSSSGEGDEDFTNSGGEGGPSCEFTSSSRSVSRRSTSHKRLSGSEKYGVESSFATLRLPRISSSNKSSVAEEVLLVSPHPNAMTTSESSSSIQLLNASSSLALDEKKTEDERPDDERRTRGSPVVDGTTTSGGSSTMRSSGELMFDLEEQGTRGTRCDGDDEDQNHLKCQHHQATNLPSTSIDGEVEEDVVVSC